MNLITNQTKYQQTNTISFTKDQLNHGQKRILQKCVQHNEKKSVVTERFIRTFKNEIYKYMNLISTNVYIDKLDHIANKCNRTYNNTIKMKLVNVKSRTYIDSSKQINDKDPKI